MVQSVCTDALTRRPFAPAPADAGSNVLALGTLGAILREHRRIEPVGLRIAHALGHRFQQTQPLGPRFQVLAVQ
ncbi:MULTISPECIES: hypothetical protein [Pseudomonas aeruginosa group]|uniref:hypothetical protein n=1 Tax=Pseudomonas aeruginosa TaxID=287 RepID=UPI0027424766|nr:hypothetical protein [Pseudomonas aeruginosa]